MSLIRPVKTPRVWVGKHYVSNRVDSQKRIGLSFSSKNIGLANIHSTHSLPPALIKQSNNKKKTWIALLRFYCAFSSFYLAHTQWHFSSRTKQKNIVFWDLKVKCFFKFGWFWPFLSLYHLYAKPEQMSCFTIQIMHPWDKLQKVLSKIWKFAMILLK